MNDSEQELTRRIGLRLRAARHARRLSLAELAELTDGVYSKSRISNYEQGIRRLSVEGAQSLARALGNVSAAYLLCLNEDEATSFTEDELLLLDVFRQVDAPSRRFVLTCAEAVQHQPPPSPAGNRGRASHGD
ncbi:helix-turn-helix domain-containing protein [uncultured Thiohalocapsa sp.]|uniref:helix-turn-helix domain-containing protein n=1 Tax=uncultured Thiohalocapsa sp. TaxID=768990 RepID=UPI0025F0C996|nr:helix-turn-helix domain-containing protein [uncultured Thiohalocapsa sp.]